MKSLFPDIPWKDITTVGFDMDGTLYDEFDFIYQVYHKIAKTFSQKNNEEEIFQFMLLRWLEKGSSYPFIFKETLETFKIKEGLHKKYIEVALSIFRNFKPKLTLTNRKKIILKELKKEYNLFIVSNGSSVLQWNKVKALKLEKYVDKKNIVISGDFGKNYEKPNLKSIEMIPILRNNKIKKNVVFIGDRDTDERFAAKAGFHFIKINDKLI